jgi:zinc/manganese transport system permease protein
MLEFLQYSFIQNAFIASFFVSIVAAIVGYFMLVRGLTFAGHAFSHVGFAGAAGAVWLGINPIYGLLAFTIAAAIGIGSLGKELRERDITIGIMFTLALAFGVLFLFLYNGYAEEAYSILFGTILGISSVNVWITAFFSTEVAQARGISTQKLSIIFLILAAITVSVSVQVVGVLLIFTLLVGPAATAMRLVAGPYKTIMLAIGLGLFYSWASIFLAAITNLPVSFFIATLSFGIYLPVRIFVPVAGGGIREA